jgi:hypothetical protein
MGKAVMLIWVVEPLLFEVCAPEREATGICGMITRSSRLLTAGSFPPQTDVSERLVGLIPIGVGLPKGTLRVLRSIFRASLLSELDTLLRDQSSFKRLSIKICLAGDKMGIRFNMHDGTLDTALAKIWARVCMAVVQNAMMDDEKFRELFRRTVRNMNLDDVAYVWVDLLIDLGIGPSDFDGFRKGHMVSQRSTQDCQHDIPSSPFLPTVKIDACRIGSAEPITPGWLP